MDTPTGDVEAPSAEGETSRHLVNVKPLRQLKVIVSDGTPVSLRFTEAAMPLLREYIELAVQRDLFAVANTLPVYKAGVNKGTVQRKTVTVDDLQPLLDAVKAEVDAAWAKQAQSVQDVAQAKVAAASKAAAAAEPAA